MPLPNLPSASSPTPAARSDADNLQRIESARKRHETLRAERIRCEHEVETLKRTVAEGLAEIKTTFGTDDLDALRRKVAENHRANTEATDAYLAQIEAAERAYSEANQGLK